MSEREIEGCCSRIAQEVNVRDIFQPAIKKKTISVAAGAQILDTCITILRTQKCLHSPQKHMHVWAHTNMCSDEHASPRSENLEKQNMFAHGHTAVCPHGLSRDAVRGLRLAPKPNIRDIFRHAIQKTSNLDRGLCPIQGNCV